MDRNEFSKIASAIRTYYPREDILPNNQALELWYHQLKDIDYNTAVVAVNKWVSLNRWSPSIADIRQIASEIVSEPREDWGEAWAKVRKSISRFGMYDEAGALDSLDPLTRKAVEALGYQHICQSEEIGVERANFRMIYENLVNRQIEDDQISPGIKVAIDELVKKSADINTKTLNARREVNGLPKT